jgi:hypothetical protein
MPIEIRELVVRARVDPAGGERGTPATLAAGGDGRSREQRIVEACVREVLRIVEEKRER